MILTYLWICTSYILVCHYGQYVSVTAEFDLLRFPDLINLINQIFKKKCFLVASKIHHHKFFLMKIRSLLRNSGFCVYTRPLNLNQTLQDIVVWVRKWYFNSCSMKAQLVLFHSSGNCVALDIKVNRWLWSWGKIMYQDAGIPFLFLTGMSFLHCLCC